MIIRKMALAALLMTIAAGTARADSTLNFIPGNFSSVTPNTGNIFTASSFAFADLIAGGGTGIFSGVGVVNFGAETFNTTTGITLSHSGFGTFTTTSVSAPTIGPGSISYYDLGVYTAPGGVGVASSFVVSFQGNNSSSGTMSVPPAGLVPEPASMALFGIGMTGLFVMRRFFKRAATV